MNIGILLSSGDSLENMKKSGQDLRFIKYYVNKYAKSFDKVFIFSYKRETYDNLPKNVEIVPNRYKLHRYIYGLLLPFINFSSYKKCNVVRAFHSLGTVPAIIGKVALSKPFVYNQGYDYKKFAIVEKKYFQYFLLCLIEPVANLLAAKIILLTANKFSWTPPRNTIYIPNGVDLTVFRPENKSKSTLTILNVGRLEAQKNQENLIKAMVGLDANLVIVGDGTLKNKLKALANRLHVKLEIIEKITNNKINRIYNKADIFALPSKVEGAPKVLLEAMACGLPVVVSKIDIVDEIVKDKISGLYCSQEPQSINKSLSELIRNDKLRDLISKNARETIVKKFDITKIISQEIKVLMAVSK